MMLMSKQKKSSGGKLQDVAKQVHKHDMLIITGVMNAKVGNLVNGFERVMDDTKYARLMIM